MYFTLILSIVMSVYIATLPGLDTEPRKRQEQLAASMVTELKQWHNKYIAFIDSTNDISDRAIGIGQMNNGEANNWYATTDANGQARTLPNISGGVSGGMVYTFFTPNDPMMGPGDFRNAIEEHFGNKASIGVLIVDVNPATGEDVLSTGEGTYTLPFDPVAMGMRNNDVVFVTPARL